MKKYILDHWHGRRSLFWSFWINLVLMRFGILYADQFTHPPFVEKSELAVVATGIYFLIFHVAVNFWQIRGVIKSADNYVSGFGSPIIAMACHFGIAFSLLFTGFAVHASYQSLFVEDKADPANQRAWNHSVLGDYTLRGEGKFLFLSGDLRIGISDAVAKMLDQHPETSVIVLKSNGGRVVEGRKLARLFQTRGLNTLVFDECKSACTTAFIGGQRRMLGPKGVLGFHQFSLDNVYHNPYIDPKAEQNIDLVFYAGQGVSSAFLDVVFQASQTEMWFPEVLNLVKAGIVHEIMRENSEN